MQHLVITLLLTAFSAQIGFSAPQAQEIPRKKLIQYGWDYRTPDYIRTNIREMEKRPFDGIIFRLKGHTRLFDEKPWDEETESFKKILDDCKNIQWDKFTDNFIIINASVSPNMDWFDDSHWKATQHNLKIILNAAVAARARGLVFDPETYESSPWSYWTQPRAKEKTFEEYQAKARERGAEITQIIQREMPEALIQTFYGFSLFESIADDPDPARRKSRLAKHPYGIYQAFLNGMLDAADSGLTFADGNEYSYYYRSPSEFFESYWGIKQRFLSLVAPENRQKYQEKMKVSQALYPDYIFGQGSWKDKRLSPAPQLSSEDRVRWFEHNVYYGLKTADEFVWMYNENINWWEDKDIPEGIEEAISRARARLLKGKPLNDIITEKVNEAEAMQKKKLQSSTLKSTANIVKANNKKPAIDGNLDEEFWQTIKPLESFISPVSRGSDLPKEATLAKISYDDENLYVAIRCSEPDVKKMNIVRSPIWLGDSINLFFSLAEKRELFAQLIVNPNNVQWDQISKHQGQDDEEPIGWKSATKISDQEWTVEMAIPWETFGSQPPASGETRFANICRYRVSTADNSQPQLSSWSQVVSLFSEPESFGTWIFH